MRLESAREELNARSTAEVLDTHLRYREAGELERDLEENYAESVVLLCENGVFRGRSAIRRSAERLNEQLAGGKFAYQVERVAGPYAFLEWSAESKRHHVKHGADSFVIANGQIVMQTISYQLVPAD
jgi:hypothetical protein